MLDQILALCPLNADTVIALATLTALVIAKLRPTLERIPGCGASDPNNATMLLAANALTQALLMCVATVALGKWAWDPRQLAVMLVVVVMQTFGADAGYNTFKGAWQRANASNVTSTAVPSAAPVSSDSPAPSTPSTPVAPEAASMPTPVAQSSSDSLGDASPVI